MKLNPKHKNFLEAYDGCHDSFVKYCSALCYGKMNTEDLIQDVILSAYKNFDKIAKKDELSHYLIRAARNKSISNWRKKKPQTELNDLSVKNLESKYRNAEVNLDIQYLYKLLSKLPETQREAIVLFEISGFKIKEIAKMQESSEGAVKTKLSRGRQKLKDMMKQEEIKINVVSKTSNQIKE